MMPPFLRFAAVACAFAAPIAFVACSLSPLSDPGTMTTSTGGSTSTGGTTATAGSTASGGGTSSGGSTSTGGSTSSGGSAGSAGSTMSTGGAGTGGSTMSTGGAGTGGSTMSTGGAGGSGGSEDAGSDAPNDASACGAVESVFALEPGIHVASCTPLTWSTNPPTSGMHYPIWAAFKSYAKPVPRGFYVHSMEHGAVVFTYSCSPGCDADVAALQAYLDARPADPLCVAPLKNRFIVTPDPLLDVPFAASAWGAHLKMQCLDFAAIGAFLDAHYAKAPENFCFDGTDVTDPASGIPASCGDPVMDAGSD